MSANGLFKGIERRSVQRVEIEAAVICRVGARSLNAIAYDLSTDGCMIESSIPSLKAGDPIELRFPGQIPLAGKVVWGKHRNAGVQFSRQLDSSQVSQIVEVYGRVPRAKCERVEHSPCGSGLEVDIVSTGRGPGHSGGRYTFWHRSRLASTAELVLFGAVIACSLVLLVR